MVLWILSAVVLAGPQAMQQNEGGSSASADAAHATRSGRARLSLMRADGVELAWIEGQVDLPSFDSTPFIPDVYRFEASDLVKETSIGDDTPDAFRLVVDRGTALRDGGISGSHASLHDRDDSTLQLASIAAGEGEYDIYDLSLAWDAFTPGPVTVSFIGGLKAIDARFGKVVSDGAGSVYRDARGVAAVPVIGGGVAWRISDDVSLVGNASTQTFSGQGTMLDMSAETSISLAPNVGLNAGYQFIRSAIEVRSLSTELEREGVYARLQIRF